MFCLGASRFSPGNASSPKPPNPCSIVSTFLAELIGTALLIILGDGVVANVVLNKTKGNNSGWIVITTGWLLLLSESMPSTPSAARTSTPPSRSASLPSANSLGPPCPAMSPRR